MHVHTDTHYQVDVFSPVSGRGSFRRLRIGLVEAKRAESLLQLTLRV